MNDTNPTPDDGPYIDLDKMTFDAKEPNDDPINQGDYELKLCNFCNQMTNHIGTQCMKCRVDNQPTPTSNETLRNDLRKTLLAACHEWGRIIIEDKPTITIVSVVEGKIDELAALIEADRHHHIARAEIAAINKLTNKNNFEIEYCHPNHGELPCQNCTVTLAEIKKSMESKE